MGKGGEVREHQGGMNSSCPATRGRKNDGAIAMKFPRRQFLHLTTGAAVLSALPQLARAEAYPTKPIRLIVPVPPAGTFDIVGRLIANSLSKRLGQQFVVENRGGAATNLGTGLVAHAAADGYTLLLAGSPGAINATLYHNLDFSFARDIAPVASIERAPLDHGRQPGAAGQDGCAIHQLCKGQPRQDSIWARAASARPAMLPASCST